MNRESNFSKIVLKILPLRSFSKYDSWNHSWDALPKFNMEPENDGFRTKNICAMVKSRYIGDGHPTFNRNPYNGYINPYYWVDDHPLIYGNNGSLDPGTYTIPGFHFQVPSC